jgi:hypothetical protein
MSNTSIGRLVLKVLQTAASEEKFSERQHLTDEEQTAPNNCRIYILFGQNGNKLISELQNNQLLGTCTSSSSEAPGFL